MVYTKVQPSPSFISEVWCKTSAATAISTGTPSTNFLIKRPDWMVAVKHQTSDMGDVELTMASVYTMKPSVQEYQGSHPNEHAGPASLCRYIMR